MAYDDSESGSLAQMGSVAFAKKARMAYWEALETVYMELPPQPIGYSPVVCTAPLAPFNRETNNALIERCLKGDFDD